MVHGRHVRAAHRRYCTRATNPRGEVCLTVEADDTMACPGLKVRADFMALGERVVVYPDRQADLALAAVTGNALLGLDEDGNPLPSVAKGRRPAPLPAGTDPDTAGAVAQVIGHVLSTAVTHGVQSDRPLTRSNALPEDIPAPRPYLPRYQHVELAEAGYDPTTDAIATHLLGADQPVVRVLVPENAAAAHWTYDHAGKAFRAMSPDQVAALLGTLSVTHLDDFTTAFDLDADLVTGRRSPRLRSDAFTGLATAELSRRWFGGDFLDAVADAASVVVTTVQATVTDAATGAEQVVDTIVATVATVVTDTATGLVTAYDAALQTVEDALAFARTLLRKVGAAVDDVIRFLRHVFDWADILVAQQVIERYLVQTRSLVGNLVHSAADRAVGGIEAARAALTRGVDAWQGGGGRGAAGSDQSRARSGPPSDSATGYLVSMLTSNILGGTPGSDYSAEYGAQLGTIVDDLTAAMASLTAQLPELVDTGALADPTRIFSTGMDVVLQAVQAVAGLALDAAEDVLNAVVALLDTMLDMLYAIGSARIDIPVLTDFYEKIVLAGDGGQLTMFSLLALVAAVPLTVTVKAARNDDEPAFTPAERDAFLAMDASDHTWITNPFDPAARARRESGSDSDPTLPFGDTALKALAVGCHFVYFAGLLVWAPLESYSDLVEVLDEADVTALAGLKFYRPLSTVLLICEFVCELSDFPWETDFANPVDEVAFWVWLTGLLPVVSLGVGAVSSRWSGTPHRILVGTYGFIAAALMSYVLIARIDEGEPPASLVAEAVRDLCVSLARITQLVLLAKEPTVHIGATVVEFLCFLGAAAATTASALAGIVEFAKTESP